MGSLSSSLFDGASHFICHDFKLILERFEGIEHEYPDIES